MRRKLAAFTLAARPKTLTASVGPVILGLALSGSSTVQHPVLALLILTVAVLLQIGANLSNDYFDHKHNVDGKDRLGPVRASSSGLLKPHEVRVGFVSCFAVSAIIGGYLVTIAGLPILIIGIASIVFAYLYTGGPRPLSYVGLGEVLAFIFFGPVTVWGTWFILTGTGGYLPLIIGIGPGSIAASIMAINNMRDRKTDASSGKITLAVRLGERASRLLPLTGVVTSMLLPLYLSYRLRSAVVLLAVPVSLIFMQTWCRILHGPIDSSQNLSLASTAKYMLAYCTALSIGLLVSM